MIDLSLIKEKLSVGDVVKNYKEMCSILEEEEKSGRSKNYQLKEWERYFSFSKKGQKILITEIYEEQLPRIDLRNNGNNSIYVKYIQVLLLNELIKVKLENEQNSNDENFAIFTKLNILNFLGMVNDNYRKIENSEVKKICSPATSFDINHFYQRTYKKLDEILFTSLNNLERRMVIKYTKHTMITERINGDYNSRLATDAEESDILDVKKNVLDSMGIENMNLVYLKFKTDEFYKKLNKQLYRLYGWENTFNVYKIIYSNNYLQKELLKIENEISTLELNSKITRAINEQAVVIYDRTEQKSEDESNSILHNNDLTVTEWGNLNVIEEEKKIFKLKSNYVEMQKKLCDLLIKL